jgi:hypothetical protein
MITAGARIEFLYGHWFDQGNFLNSLLLRKTKSRSVVCLLKDNRLGGFHKKVSAVVGTYMSFTDSFGPFFDALIGPFLSKN